MMYGMRQVIATTENGAQLSREQLQAAGVSPGDAAVVEVRRYTVEDWVAESEGQVLSTDEFVAHLQRCPSPQ